VSLNDLLDTVDKQKKCVDSNSIEVNNVTPRWTAGKQIQSKCSVMDYRETNTE